MSYCKVRFYTPGIGATSGLVLDTEAVAITAETVSRYYPKNEFRRMARFETSPDYVTWLEAFNHEFM